MEPSRIPGRFGLVLEQLGRGDLLDEDPLLRAAAEAGALIAFAIAPDGEILRVRGPVLDAITDARGDTEGANVFELYADVPALLGAVARALRGVPVRALITIDGAPLDCHYIPVRDGTGAVAGLRGVALPLDAADPPPEAPALTMDDAGLSWQEQRVVRRLARGMLQTEIARRVCLSPKTVTTYVTRARTKIADRFRVRLDTPAALVAFAAKRDWDLDADDDRVADDPTD